MKNLLLALSVAFVTVACDGEDPAVDAGRTPDAARVDAALATCARNEDCEDDLYCNGRETCVDATCVSGSPPCSEDSTCDEDDDACVSISCGPPDNGDPDGDGRLSRACGGDDCDDGDVNRFPGNTEVCDVDDHDEDCDPTTFGFRDADGDTHPDMACCNGDVCGTDCNDANPGIGPTVPEVCGDGVDNDCDGAVDEGVVRTCYADADGDGFAAADAATMSDCSCPAGWTDTEPAAGTTDCLDDASMGGADVHPGAPERCDRIDTDCSEGGTLTAVEAEDHDDDGHSPPDAACTGGFPKDDCEDRHELVYPGQRERFTSPWCPRPLSIFSITGRGWVCGSEEVLPSWDYDCDDVISPEPTHSGCRTAAGRACLLSMPDGCMGAGPASPAGPSDCGQRRDHVDCSCEEDPESLTGATCTPSDPNVRRVACR